MISLRELSLNPYRYNLHRNFPKPPLGSSPFKPRKQQLYEIKEKIIKLEEGTPVVNIYVKYTMHSRC
jgi:hypothetical protein